MAFTCGFSNGFSSGFAICEGGETPPAATPAVILTGVPNPKRKMFTQVEDLQGSGFVTPVSTGRLTGDACLKADMKLPQALSGHLVRDSLRYLVGVVQARDVGLAVGEGVCIAALPQMHAGLGYLAGEFLAYVIGAVRTGGIAAMTFDRFVRGRMRIRSGAEAAPVLEENEEDILLAAAVVMIRRLTAKNRNRKIAP